MDDRGKADNRPTLDELRCRLEQETARRQRAEARAAHLIRLLRAINGVNQLIVREKDRLRLIQGSCDILVAIPGYAGAWIVLLDETDEPVSRPRPAWGKWHGRRPSSWRGRISPDVRGWHSRLQAGGD